MQFYNRMQDSVYSVYIYNNVNLINVLHVTLIFTHQLPSAVAVSEYCHSVCAHISPCCCLCLSVSELAFMHKVSWSCGSLDGSTSSWKKCKQIFLSCVSWQITCGGKRDKQGDRVGVAESQKNTCKESKEGLKEVRAGWKKDCDGHERERKQHNDRRLVHLMFEKLTRQEVEDKGNCVEKVDSGTQAHAISTAM